MRLVVAAATALAALSAGTAVAAVTPDPPGRRDVVAGAERITLAGRNVVTGNQSGLERVHVPADSYVTVRASGPGRVAGVALLEDPYGSNPSAGRFLFAGRAGDCVEPGCSPSEHYEFSYDTTPGDSPRPLLREGSYVLYLIADEARARVVLELEGVPGRARLTPAPTDAVDLKTPAERFEETGPAGTAWWSGSSYATGNAGLVFSMLFLKGDELAATRMEHCQYAVVEPPPDEVSYGPHCGTAASFLGAGYNFAVPPDYDRDRYSLPFLSTYNDEGTDFPSESRGLGFYVQSPRPLDDLGVTALTLRAR